MTLREKAVSLVDTWLHKTMALPRDLKDMIEVAITSAVQAQIEKDAAICEQVAADIEKQIGWRDNGYLTGCRNEALSRAAAIRSQTDASK